MKQTSRGLAPSLNTGHSTFTGARQRLAVALVAIVIAFAGAQTAGAAVGDVVATGYCGTTANGADGHNLAWTLTENGEDDIEISSETYTALTLTITGSGAMDDYASSDSPWNATNTYRDRVTKLVLPEGITHIGNHAFYFTNFTGPLTIPSTVQTIGTSGFYGFYGATSVTIPASVTSIGEKALQSFGKNASSCTVAFAEGSQLASIGANAFNHVNADLDLRNCTQLTAITAEEVFKGYNKTVTFPRTMTSVCANAFKIISGGGNPKVKLSCKGFLVINDEYQSYNANEAVRTITSKFDIKPSGSKAVTIRQGVIDGLTWNTEGSYYEINDEQDLIYLGLYVIADAANDCAGLTFKMTADLDFSEKANDERCKDNLGRGTGNFLPIGLSGESTAGGAGFAGSFYGQGHSITGLRYNYSSNVVGLFGLIKGSAVVDGVTLISPTFRASGSVGGIVGTMYGGTVSNCAVVNGSLDGGSGNSVGGIVGYSYSETNTVSGCTVVGTSVSGTSVSGSDINYVGIIVGDNQATLTIKDCTYHTATGLPVCGYTSSQATTTESDNTRVYQLTIGEGITASGATYSHALLPGKAYYANGSTVTLGHGTREGYVFGGGYTVTPAQTITDGTFTMPAEDVTVGATWTIDPDHFAVSSDGKTYTIKTVTGWNVFCDALQDNTTYNRFSGKTVKLGANISVTRMAGSSQHDFCGTFDGGGHTITLAIGSAESPFGEDYAALFRNVTTTKANSNDAEDSPASIHSLVVDGHIYTSKKYAAGIVGNQYGTVTISNCRSSVVIHSSVINSNNSNNNDGTHGGIVANQHGGALTLTGCIYDGRMLTTNATTGCGGLVGYHSGGTCTISNSLYAPADCTPAQGESDITDGATICRNYSGTPANCYYTATLGSAQGKALHSVTAGDDVTLALSGTATEYTVSGITAYEGNQGIKYGTTYYAGSGDAVRLTLSNTATGDVPLGYQYGYTASAGTLSGSTLTMPAEDVTVSPALRSTHAAVPVTYVDADGNTVSDQTAIALDGTETSLGKSNQETWYFVGLTTVAFDHRLNLNGIVHLILADGCTMNVTSNADGIAVNGSLTIYGQTDGTGTLNATSGDGDGISTHIGNLTISGGRVTVTGDKGFGIITNGGNLTISGGRVTVTGGNAGIHTDSGNITISGGRVTATGGNGGILFNSGTITLGCTTASDFIYVSSYGVGSGGSLNIVGQKLYDEDGNSYSGTIIDYADLDGKTLRLSPGIALTARQAPDGNYWTTYYNGTRGFTIDEDENACAYTATYGDGKLTLHKLGKEIPAETAVIIVAENNVVSMTATTLPAYNDPNDLHGVDVDTDVDDLGTGTFYVLGMTTVDNEKHFGFHRYTGEEMAAHKAFVLVSGSQALARSLTMVFDEASGIESLTPDAAPKAQAADHWFTLDGRRLQAKPTAPGIYINNGKKVVIK